MKTLLAFGLLLTSAMLIDPCWSQGEKGSPKPTLPKGTPAEQIKSLIAQHDAAMAAFRKLYDAAKTEEEQEKLEALFPDPAPYAKLLLEIAEKNLKDSAAVDALIWSARHERSGKAKAILLRDYLLDPKIGRVCLNLRRESGEEPQKALRRVLADNPDKEAQACAAYALGYCLKGNANLARMIQRATAKELGEWEKNYSKAEMAALKKADAAALQKEAEMLLERVAKDKHSADIKFDTGEGWIKLGDLAARELYEMRHLQPGMPAPDTAGEDIDGKPMKLSDFRGKVVLLDFWGFW
jgi:hypothetical protein